MRRMQSYLRGVLVMHLVATTASCASPEAHRVRDGGPGADIGNTRLADTPPADPQAADTTLWPGRALAPVERLARGEMPPPVGVSPWSRGQGPVTPNVPASKAEQSAFDKGGSANPRAPARPPAPPP